MYTSDIKLVSKSIPNSDNDGQYNELPHLLKLSDKIRNFNALQKFNHDVKI